MTEPVTPRPTLWIPPTAAEVADMINSPETLDRQRQQAAALARATIPPADRAAQEAAAAAEHLAGWNQALADAQFSHDQWVKAEAAIDSAPSDARDTIELWVRESAGLVDEIAATVRTLTP